VGARLKILALCFSEASLGRSIREAWTVKIWFQVIHADRIRGAGTHRSQWLVAAAWNHARPGFGLLQVLVGVHAKPETLSKKSDVVFKKKTMSNT
jgi:hypothetical protein